MASSIIQGAVGAGAAGFFDNPWSCRRMSISAAGPSNAPCLVYNPPRNCLREPVSLRNCISRGDVFVWGSASAEATRSPLHGAGNRTLRAEKDAEYKIQEQILAHQQKAAKLSRLEEARTLVNQKTSGILSTISKKYDGFPFGSMVIYAGDDDGSILLSVSSLSPHTKDLELNPKCSILVPRDPTDRSDTLVTVIGEALSVQDPEESAVRAKFLEKNPDAFWADFGDFKFFRILPKKVRYLSGIVTGLAVVAEFTGEEFQAASVDPISKFAAPVAGHMNKDHSDQTAQIVENSLGVKVDFALIQDLDRFGFNVLAKRQGKNLKLRIPFPRPAEDRKSVKTLIIEMLTGKEN